MLTSEEEEEEEEKNFYFQPVHYFVPKPTGQVANNRTIVQLMVHAIYELFLQIF